jgi:ribosomal protein S16
LEELGRNYGEIMEMLLKKGAKPTETVARILKKEKII